MRCSNSSTSSIRNSIRSSKVGGSIVTVVVKQEEE